MTGEPGFTIIGFNEFKPGKICMTFIPSVQPPPALEEPAWWFLFQGSQLLVSLNGDEARVPFIQDPRE
ncbi:MAG: hypothetical protein JRD68_14900, partial [Deltaproteobacteria bacterium]|nr:hypothetical protein [Deltaproteobacteria bacterium]